MRNCQKFTKSRICRTISRKKNAENDIQIVEYSGNLTDCNINKPIKVPESVNQPAKKRAETQRNRRGIVRNLQNPAPAERFQEKRRLFALNRAFRRVRALPSELLRLRFLEK